MNFMTMRFLWSSDAIKIVSLSCDVIYEIIQPLRDIDSCVWPHRYDKIVSFIKNRFYVRHRFILLSCHFYWFDMSVCGTYWASDAAAICSKSEP